MDPRFIKNSSRVRKNYRRITSYIEGCSLIHRYFSLKVVTKKTQKRRDLSTFCTLKFRKFYYNRK